MPREDPACVNRMEKGGSLGQGDVVPGWWLSWLSTRGRPTCGSYEDPGGVQVWSIMWLGRVSHQAPVHVVSHDILYTTAFSVSGSTLSVQASFLFPDEEIRELALQCLESWHTWPGLKPLNTKCPEPSHPFLCLKTLEEETFVKNGTFFLMCAHICIHAMT